MIITAMPLSAFVESIVTTSDSSGLRGHIRFGLSTGFVFNGSHSDESMAEYESLYRKVGDRTNDRKTAQGSGFQALVPEQVKIAPSGDITAYLLC